MMDGFDTDGLRDDLADLPAYFRAESGPTGEAVMERAAEMGFDGLTAMLAGNAAHAHAWKRSEDQFKAELLSMQQPAELLFEACRDLLAHEGLWPWEAGEE